MLVGRVDVGCYGVRGWSHNVEKYGGGDVRICMGFPYTVVIGGREKAVLPPK